MSTSAGMTIGSVWSKKKKAAPEKTPAKTEPARKPGERQRKLSFKEQRELDALPQRIEVPGGGAAPTIPNHERPPLFQKGKEEIAQAKSGVSAIEEELSKVYQRWESLDGLRLQTP